MVYAIAMKTNRNFQRALGHACSGRTAHPLKGSEGVGFWALVFILTAYAKQCILQPSKRALLFGYFRRMFRSTSVRQFPWTIFTCLRMTSWRMRPPCLCTDCIVDSLNQLIRMCLRFEAFADSSRFSSLHFPTSCVIKCSKRGDLAIQSLLEN